MAEVKDTGSSKSQPQAEEPQRAKRKLRAAPETVRERSQRLGAENDSKQEAAAQKSVNSGKTGVFTSFWNGFTWPVRKLGALLKPLGRFKIVRFFGRILYPRYLRNSWRELRLVTWPDRKTSWKLTYAVIVFSVIFGVIVFIVDFVLNKIFKEILLK